jgi:RimJ/RimL family protein N-acetyltransferase
MLNENNQLKTKTSLVLVNPAIDDQAKFLYELLNKRTSKNNISNRTVKSWKDHLNFIDYNNPFSDWYIIEKNQQWVGSIYLTQRNEIGIYIAKEFRGKGIGKDALKILIQKHPRRFYYSNVNPNNEDLKKFFQKIFGNTNYKLVEMCYEIVPE